MTKTLVEWSNELNRLRARIDVLERELKAVTAKHSYQYVHFRLEELISCRAQIERIERRFQ